MICFDVPIIYVNEHQMSVMISPIILNQSSTDIIFLAEIITTDGTASGKNYVYRACDNGQSSEISSQL